MTKYRKIPEVINAYQYVGNNSQEIIDALGMEVPDDVYFTATGGMVIPSLAGEYLVLVNDWVIKSKDGEFYPCKPETFAAMYEKV